MRRGFDCDIHLGEADDMELCARACGMYLPGVPAQPCGPPEQCYPAEAPEADIEQVAFYNRTADMKLPREVVLLALNLTDRQLDDLIDERLMDCLMDYDPREFEKDVS